MVSTGPKEKSPAGARNRRERDVGGDVVISNRA